MCLIVFDWRMQPTPWLRLAANRDEYHRRPTAPLHVWPTAKLIGGRDLQAGGTWLAANRDGHLAALTNVRDDREVAPRSAPSRGMLVSTALTQPAPEAWLQRLVGHEARHYAGFNLLFFTGERLWHVHHGRDGTRLNNLPPGTYGLSNATLDTPWPKLTTARQTLIEALATRDWRARMRQGLKDTRPAPDADLPDAGIGKVHEQRLSSIFIVGEHYGTRATTLATARDNGVTLEEQSFGPGGQPTEECRQLSTAALLPTGRAVSGRDQS
ncbi:NRDE family protein [Salinicola avicenniae]|uniref:NRDE family protein n=1 Tax=Salinicola avicenniae TaxID=2916836 RepID=UPI0021F7E1FE|nr:MULTISPECIES: NRDE family protein [unclassified Salinicola]